MFDLMYKADDKAAWDAFLAAMPEDVLPSILVDEIGPIVITPAVLDEDGDVIEEAVIDLSHHVNLRVLRPATTYTDESGVEHTDGVDCAVLAAGGPGVEWVSPDMVSSPERIWAGGMNYWKPA